MNYNEGTTEMAKWVCEDHYKKLNEYTTDEVVYHIPQEQLVPLDEDVYYSTQLIPPDGNFFNSQNKPNIPHGGPSSYYDMPFKNWVTVNDMMEYLAEQKWGKYGIHLKDIFKGLCRWGEKSGTTVEYDTRKIIYYGCRILQMVSGKQSLRDYLKELLDDPQFK